MNLVKLPKIVRKKRRRGRGVANGGAKSGRGMKGQRSRAGYSQRAGFEGGQTPLYQRLPKKRGAKQIFPSQVTKPVAINVARLEQMDDGSIVGLSAFRKAGLTENRDDKVKLIGASGLTKKLTVRVHAATKGATTAVEKAGGTVELIEVDAS